MITSTAIQEKSPPLSSAAVLEFSIANSVDLDQTTPLKQPGSIPFAFQVKINLSLKQKVAEDNIFSCLFFLLLK